MKKYEDTSIDNEIYKIMSEKLKYTWDVTFSRDAVKTLVEGLAIYLGSIKDKNKVKAAIIEDRKGQFHFGAFVEYIESEEGKGGFNITYTFDVDDIKPEFEIVSAKEPVLHYVLADVALTKFGMVFHACEGKEFIVPIMCTTADCLKSYLHANVAIDPTIEFDDFFTATAEVDGDRVYYKLTPHPAIKQHVKDDVKTEATA